MGKNHNSVPLGPAWQLFSTIRELVRIKEYIETLDNKSHRQESENLQSDHVNISDFPRVPKSKSMKYSSAKVEKKRYNNRVFATL